MTLPVEQLLERRTSAKVRKLARACSSGAEANLCHGSETGNSDFKIVGAPHMTPHMVSIGR